jgi:glycosyltransferase involved in cell wall biosynthesis
MEGHLDWVDRHVVRGWAWYPGEPARRARVAVLVDGVRVGAALADQFRDDLLAGSIGDGHASFDFIFSRLIAHTARVVQLADAETGEPLEGASLDLPGPTGFGATARAALDGAIQLALAGARSTAELAELSMLLLEGARSTRPQPVAGRPRLAVVIDRAVPRIDRDAGSQAIISHMRSLQRLGWQVMFVQGGDAGFDAEAAASLGRVGIACQGPGAGGPANVLRAWRQSIGVVYLHRLASAAAWIDVARAWCPAARIVYALADLHHLRLERAQALFGTPQPVAATRAAELAAARAADAVITHSRAEAALLARLAPEVEVHVIPWQVTPRPVTPTAASRQGVAFLGSYAHLPNRDAAELLIGGIMPEVQAADPSITLTLAGSDMPEALLAAGGPGIIVLGGVADPQSVYEAARLTVAPLRYGAGLKGKVLESLAAGVPCLISPIAAEGMDLPAALGPLVVDIVGMAAAILRLHADPALCDRLGAAGVAWVGETFSAARIDVGIRAALAQ